MEAIDSPWWIEYRRRRHRETLSVEMVIRKSFLEVLKEYADTCSVVGVQEICDPKMGRLERLFRICVFGLLALFLWYLMYYYLFTALASPLIVTTESTTYPIGEIDFPAVSLCNINRISKKSALRFAKQLSVWNAAFVNESLEDRQRIIRQYGRLLDFSFEENWEQNSLLETISQQRFDSKFILDVMKSISRSDLKLAPSCDDMILRCWWSGQRRPCDSIFTMRRTARGHCCTFNYVLDYNSADSPNQTIAEPKRQILPKIEYGLTVAINPMLDDYAYPIISIKGIELFLHDPVHFADLSAGRLVHRLLKPGQAEYIELKSLKQAASPEVRKYPVKIRRCLFRDELAEEFNHMYSYSACIVRCRIRAIQSLCKCTPYYFPTANAEGPTCKITDLKCLNKYKEKLLYLYPIGTEKTEGLEIEMEDSLYCPDCLPDCELTQHTIKRFKLSLQHRTDEAYFKEQFLEGVNTTRDDIVLSIYHQNADSVFNRLDIMPYWFEILSSIGGYAGIVFGLSVCSVVEIIYFY